MKKSVLFCAFGFVAAAAGAQEVGRVISSVPVVQQVAVPRQVCSQVPVAQAAPSTSGAGAVIGAIAGGIIGHTIGHGFGRGVATGVGAVAGAAVGNSIEGSNHPQMAVQQQCSTQTSYENRTVGYNVTYEYGGRQYTVQMPNDPGPSVRLQVTPVGAGALPPAEVARPMPSDGQPIYSTPSVAAPVYVQPAVTTYAAVPEVIVPATTVVYPTYYRPYYRPYYPVAVSLNLGYTWGGHHHHHRRWR